MKAMVIGLQPEYNYPGDIKVWKENNTKYASNHGATLICRSLLKEFEADYIEDLTFDEELNKKYDLCILAFATHVTNWRDVSHYTNFIKQLKIKTVAFSLGIQDYTKELKGYFNLHPSMFELLKIVEQRSGWIGVRGPITASLLMQNGFKHVLPIGCPTFYLRLKNNLIIKKQQSFTKPLIVYHRTMAENNWHLCKDATILGQDFLDESVFTNNFPNDPIKQSEEKEYSQYIDGDSKIQYLRDNGIFVKTFQEWFDFIGRHDFVIGPRLHGCIAALIQGIPSVMIYRDLRVKEIADFYKLPSLSYEETKKMSIQDIFNFADYTDFNEYYRLRYNNFTAFLDLINAEHKLESIHNDFIMTLQDHLSVNFQINQKLADLEKDVCNLKTKNQLLGNRTTIRLLRNSLRKIFQ